MARHLFGGGLADWTFDLGDAATSGTGASGNLAVVIGAVPVMFWDQPSGGAQYTDLTDIGGGPIDSVVSDSIGEIDQFYGPDGVVTMWADASGGAGPRKLATTTDAAALALTAIAEADSLTDAVTNNVALLAVVPLMNVAVAGVYPPRPSIAGSRVVIWVGPSTPTAGGTGAADGDLYFDSTP